MFDVYCRDGSMKIVTFENKEDAINFALAFAKCDEFTSVEVFSIKDCDYENLIFGKMGDFFVFEQNGERFQYRAYMVETDYGPENKVQIFNPAGFLLQEFQEAMDVESIIELFKEDIKS